MIKALIILGMVLLFGGLMLWARSWEKARYNGGLCTGCGHPWRYFDTDSQGGRGYKCDGCRRGTWVSYWGIDG